MVLAVAVVAMAIFLLYFTLFKPSDNARALSLKENISNPIF